MDYLMRLGQFYIGLGEYYIGETMVPKFSGDPLHCIRIQHDDIFKQIHLLQKAIRRHINDEEKLLEMRESIRPTNHIDVSEKLRAHKSHHAIFLKSLDELKNTFEKHLHLYDKIHIHRL